LTFPDVHFLGGDQRLYQVLGQMGTEETGYPLISVYEEFTPDKSLKRYGSSIDWAFGALGIPIFSTELWDVFRAAGIQRDDYYPLRPFSEEEQVKLLQWQDEALGGDGFMPWTPFEHPQLGLVEIGGWKRLYTFRNPPPARYLEEMARANTRFTLRHAAAAPRLRLRDLHADFVGDELLQISVVVENVGFLPTNLSAQAIAMHEARPVTLRLEGLPTDAFVQGAPQQDADHLAGRLQRDVAYSRFYDWPQAAHAARWLLRVPPEGATLTLRAGCPRAGTVEARISISTGGTLSILPDTATSGRAAPSPTPGEQHGRKS
jgi:hypothetical protein